MYLIKVQSIKNKNEYTFVIVDRKRLTEALERYKKSKKVYVELVGEICLKSV